MLFVVVGTQKFQLNRLLKAMDELVASGRLREPVFAQIGNSDYVPEHYEFERFLPPEVFEEKIRHCDVLVTHGGVASIMSGVKNKKPVIVFPRLAAFGEHVDDHQCEIAEAFAEAGYVCDCREADALAEVIESWRAQDACAYTSGRNEIIAEIDAFLESNAK